MAEIKNSFLKSKMNKDLDDRLIPNGEYRDANNISVGKSEDDDIGALENILGNTIAPLPTDLGADAKMIGYFADNNNSLLYLFYTTNILHYIYRYSNGVYTLLVTGSFLNFNKLNPIIGVNLVENLLFWTDNLNQPRKINVNKANSNNITDPDVPLYYTKENQISVAKYNPYEPLELLKSTTSVASATSAATVITLSAQNSAIVKGMSVIGPNITADSYIYVVDFSTSAPFTITVNANAAVTNLDTLTFLTTTMTGKDITFDFNNGNDWPGDPDFLQDLFVRFSYRFKFDDEEYSIMAPFTQPAFIPQQKGYFLAGDEDAAYRSTILTFMENGVQNVELLIPLPDKQKNLGTIDDDTYKITDVDILYKESDGLAVKVLDTIDLTLLNSESNILVYNYQSRKPYKTLPDRQTVRVYDRVPVKAKAQEVSGNRVIYGNFQSQHTPPATLNYNVGAAAKNTTSFTNWAEYPNHTLKQNRNYQVGFVLSDKFGRQSSVILSSVDAGLSLAGNFFGGSTFYHPYKSTTQNLNQWFGDALKVVINEAIVSTKSTVTGQPGLYAVPTGTGVGFNTTGVTTTINSTTFTFKLAAGQTQIPIINDYLRGEFTDFVKVTNVTPAGAAAVGTVYTVTTDGQVNNLLYSTNSNNPDVKFSYGLPNPLGWYSYKVVVKQQEQDYYNVYLPGFLNGYPLTTGATDPPIFPTNETNKSANVVLLNDNINKVPRDLNETSDQQKQFRSSVRLYGRVNNNTAATNVQFFPVNSAAVGSQFLPLSMTADTISTAFDLAMSVIDISTTNVPFYQLETNPFIARLATSNAGTTVVGTTAATMQPYLSIVETEPVESLLQLFYETTTAGLIADLNADIDTGFDGVSQLSALGYSQTEAMAANTDVTGVFYPQNNQGSNFANTQIAQVAMTVVDGAGVTRAAGNITYNGSVFTDTQNSGAQFKIKTSGTGYRIETLVNTFNYSAAGYNDGSGGHVAKSTKEEYTYTLIWTTVANSGGDTNTITFVVELTNSAPVFIDGTTLPGVIVSAGDAVGVTRQGYNGSASNNNLGLRYSIVSQSPGSYFSIADNTTGIITKTANAVPLGVYTLQLKIEDAILSNVPQLNTKSVTQAQVITVGAVPVNSAIKSPCTLVATTPVGIAPMFQSVVPDTTTSLNTRTAVWYVAGSVLAASDFNTISGITISANTTSSNFINRLGTGALTQGTIVFQCNMQQAYKISGPSFTTLQLNWVVYHRTTASDAWVQIDDTNNSNAVAIVSMINNSFNSTKYSSTAFAFNQTGEYAVIAKDAYCEYAGGYGDSAGLWVNSNDLYYSTCVVENGLDVTDNKTPKSYQYQFSSYQSGYSCATGGTTKYAPMPYSEYVDLFYLNDTLTTPSKGATYDYPNFFGFSTSTTLSEPFTQIDSSAKFDVAGIKISGDASTCSDKYARSCTSCLRPVPGAIGWL